MRRTASAILLLLAAIFCGAGGPYEGALSPDDLRHLRTIAVISALGGSFQFERIPNGGLAWLGPPDSHFLEISDWGLDPLVARTVSASLAGRFAIKPIAFRPVDFSSWNYALLKHSALNLNGDPGIDAYVVVLRDWRADEIGHSSYAVGGLGLYRRRGAPYGVFASYRIVVVDALTGDTIASRAALLPDGRLPWLRADQSLWPKTANDLSEAQRTTLAADERQLIGATLLPTLKQMDLTR